MLWRRNTKIFHVVAKINSWDKKTQQYWILQNYYGRKDVTSGLEIKKIARLPFGDQLEKYSRQKQIFSPQFV